MASALGQFAEQKFPPKGTSVRMIVLVAKVVAKVTGDPQLQQIAQQLGGGRAN